MEPNILDQMFNTPATTQILRGFEIVFTFAPIWLPIFLVIAFWMTWLTYTRTKFLAEQQHVLLEIILPQTVEKSPAAMEAIFTGLHLKPGESTFIDRLFLGKARPWWSFELVSDGGAIHFYAWTRAGMKQIVMNHFYANYPGVEIQEVQDYASAFDFSLDKHGLWGSDFVLADKDYSPIKTYVDYGVTSGKADQNDPLASLLEFLGSVGPRQKVWIQILFQVHTERPVPGKLLTWSSFKDEAQAAIKGIYASPQMVDIEEGPNARKIKKLSPSQIEQIKGIEKKSSKFVFDVGIRGLYIAEKDAFDGTNIPALIGSFRVFSSGGFNGFKPTRYLAGYDYPWEDFRGAKQNKERKTVFDAYRRRSWFHPPHKTRPFILNTEELATIFHLPGEVAQTPTLPRIESTRKEAPSNLPI